MLEFRQGYALSGIVLYVFSMVFVVYIASIKVAPPVWNVLFWIIVLFASINAVVKSFVQESGARQLYYYQLVDPAMLLLGKIAYYNTVIALRVEPAGFRRLQPGGRQSGEGLATVRPGLAFGQRWVFYRVYVHLLYCRKSE